MLKSEAKKRLLARRADLCLNGVKEEVESALSIGRRSLVLNLDIGANSKASQKVIREVEVIVWKADRGVAGSKIFVSNRTAATQALSAKFLGSVYLQSKNAAGENNQKAKLIQEQFVSNLDVVKKLRERMVQYDTKTPFMIPQGYSDTVSIIGWEDRWDLSGEIIDLTINWGKLTLDHCCKWQRDFNGYSDDVDHISSIWTKDLLLNSMDPELRKVVEEKFLKLDAYQQGGITFLKILLDTVFKMNSMSHVGRVPQGFYQGLW